jgi:hypothetical protein
VEAIIVWGLLWSWYQTQGILHVDAEDKRAPVWNDRDMQGDKPVRIPRDLAKRLKTVFPNLTSKRDNGKERRAVLHGIALEPVTEA